MCQRSLRVALWALAALGALAPAADAGGNVGCLFSPNLCEDILEWCYDDFAFGKCIPEMEELQDEKMFYRYSLTSDQLEWFEEELQRLLARGFRWGHIYSQCVLQEMLDTLRKNLDPKKIDLNGCEEFVVLQLMNELRNDAEEEMQEVPSAETASINFKPDSDRSEFADEVYSPRDDLMEFINKVTGKEPFEVETYDDSPESINYVRLLKALQRSYHPDHFDGFRERIQEDRAKESTDTDPSSAIAKKSLSEHNQIDPYADEERVGAHFRKHKLKPPPNTAEYLTGNRLDSPLDEEFRENALKNYKLSFEEKNFPFEYENPDLPEPRVYVSDDGTQELSDSGSGENIYPYQQKDQNAPALDYKNSKNMEYLMSYWRGIVESKTDQQGPLYAEGGPLKPDELQGHGSPYPQAPDKGEGHNHNEYEYDPSYTYVLFKNRFLTDWDKGISFISRLEEMLGLEKHTFTNPRVDPGEVTFKVEKNSKGYDAIDVARRVDTIKDDLRRETGAQILSTGVGDRSKHPVIRHVDTPDNLFFGLELPVLLALVGSLAVLIVGATVFAVLLKRDMNGKRKMQGLSGAAEIDSEATRDYQELCRARMSGKWSGQQTTAAAPPHPADPPQRITSLSREPEGNSPSTRSSTSSWSEEPALTNMDISTGHMVLAYMEDHLRNKDRLEQEWRALCAYEAEPCATAAALKPENSAKNRYADVLPYDHSRVTLNTLSNHVSSDYINASTITDHDPRNPAYIAAAGPLAHTAPDFWQMVWEQGSVVMVMLTRLTENGQQLCHRYWPEEGSELYHIYEVHLVSEHIWCDDYLVRSFYLKNQRTGETRTVTQFHFLSWSEHGVPASTKALLEFRRKVNKSYRGRSCPIVVHCSDGAGRSGTYCLIDMVLNRMAKGAKEIDIAATLEHIRDQRPRTVATKQQFEFVLMAVAEEVHAILKALPAHLQQMQEKKEKEKEKEKDKDAADKDKPK